MPEEVGSKRPALNPNTYLARQRKGEGPATVKMPVKIPRTYEEELSYLHLGLQETKLKIKRRTPRLLTGEGRRECSKG